MSGWSMNEDALVLPLWLMGVLAKTTLVAGGIFILAVVGRFLRVGAKALMEDMRSRGRRKR